MIAKFDLRKSVNEIKDYLHNLEIYFKDELNKALGNDSNLKLKTTNRKHIDNTPKLSNVQPKLVEDSSKSIRNDGNNVDIDVEISHMIQNSLEYSAYSNLMTKAIQRYETVMRGAR